MKNRLLPALLFGALLAAGPTHAQLSARAAFASDEAAARHQAAFAAAVRAAGMARPVEYYYRYRIDVTQLASLRRAGLDLRRLERGIRIDGPAPYEESSLFADLVVRGTVLSLATDTSRRVCFHSRYRVRVAETWQGRPADTVTVQLATGPIGNTLGFTFSGAPQLAVGQELILHLTYFDFAAHEEARKLGFANCTNNAAPGDFQVLLASSVQGEQVLSGHDLRTVTSLADLRRKLQRIAAILDKEHFYQKAF